MKKKLIGGVFVPLASALALGAWAQFAAAADYRIDPAHSFVEFRIQHLGFSWLYGRFNKISGGFSYDSGDPASRRIEVEIDTASVDSNHAERDKHIRSEDFLHVEKYPSARFRSTGYSGSDEGGTLEGELTLHGVTRPIAIEVRKVGEGKDPWGGYRAGFIGRTLITRKDFGMEYNLGPAAETMELELNVEGIRK